MGAKDTKKGTHNNKVGANGRRIEQLDPAQIYFTHARVSEQFTGCNKKIKDTLDEIVNGQTKLSDIPFITVIENFEPVPIANQPKKGGKKPTASKKKSKRAQSDDDDDDTVWMNEFDHIKTELKPFYFSLNNRRLFLIKTLHSMGLCDSITVQVKTALDREKVKYTRARCTLNAKLMSGRKIIDKDGKEVEVDDNGSDNEENSVDDDNGEVNEKKSMESTQKSQPQQQQPQKSKNQKKNGKKGDFENDDDDNFDLQLLQKYMPKDQADDSSD